ncbi:MAG: hypothetical protein U1A72_23260 [Sulfuritalea sp.]|nr:hypothetical protein [Sulfuritalea sp.]
MTTPAIDLESVDPSVRLAVVKQFLTPWAYFCLVMIPVDLILVGLWALKASSLWSLCQ